MIKRKLFMPLLLAANGCGALGALCVLLAYNSGDPSGLQYMFLAFGAVPAAVGLFIYVAGALFGVLQPLGTVVFVATLLLAFLPQLTGLGYNGSVLDAPGTAGSLLVLGVQGVFVSLAVRNHRRTVSDEAMSRTTFG